MSMAVSLEHGYLDGELLDERGGLLREQLPVLDDELVLSAAPGIRVPEDRTVVDRYLVAVRYCSGTAALSRPRALTCTPLAPAQARTSLASTSAGAGAGTPVPRVLARGVRAGGACWPGGRLGGPRQ